MYYRYMLQSQVSTVSQGSVEEDEDENVVYLGDDNPINLAPTGDKPAHAGAKLSAKQRR